METFSWSLKKILLPLSPVLLVAIIRFLFHHKISMDLVDGVEVSFAMLLLALLVFESVMATSNRYTRDTLSVMVGWQIIWFGLIVSVLIFIEELIKVYPRDLLEVIETQMRNMGISSFTDLYGELQFYSIISTLFIVPMNIFLKHKFNLEG